MWKLDDSEQACPIRSGWAWGCPQPWNDILRPDQFYRVYPRYEERLEIKRRLDPAGLFTSDPARRVGIDQGRAG